MPVDADAADRAGTEKERADYEKWFRSEVERAVKEADDPAAEWVTNEDVKKLSAEHRAHWRNAAARKA